MSDEQQSVSGEGKLKYNLPPGRGTVSSDDLPNDAVARIFADAGDEDRLLTRNHNGNTDVAFEAHHVGGNGWEVDWVKKQ
jgi:hypothetical protein